MFGNCLQSIANCLEPVWWRWKFDSVKIWFYDFTFVSFIVCDYPQSVDKWANTMDITYYTPKLTRYWIVCLSLVVLITLSDLSIVNIQLSFVCNCSILTCDRKWQIVFVVYHLYLITTVFIWVWFCCLFFVTVIFEAR